jgi:type III pantothenate kinase
MQPDSQLLLADLGNTRAKWCALADAGGDSNVVQAWPLRDPGFEDAFRASLRAREWQGVWIASVGPADALEVIERACRELLPGVPLRRARSLARLGAVRNGYDTPAQLGVDRFLGLLAVQHRWPATRVLVASIGSAVTLDLLEADGAHAGGVIAPSPEAMRRALAGLSTRLDVAEADATTTFARSSAEGIASGCSLAVAGLVERCLRDASASGEPPLLVLTGGAAAAIASRIPAEPVLVPYLVLEGLARYARLHGDDGDPVGR